MADRMILTPPELVRQMIDDLRAVAGTAKESLVQLSHSLGQQTGFLSDAKLIGLVSESLKDNTQGSAAFNALQNLNSGALTQVLETVERWRRLSEENIRSFPDELYSDLKEKLPLLVQDYPALNQMRKAKRLRGVLGNELEGVIFICDARPVFNESRDQIEGMIPITTLKIVYERQNQLSEEIEFTVSTKQLADFIKKARKAQEKLTILHERISEWLPGGCVDSEE